MSLAPLQMLVDKLYNTVFNLSSLLGSFAIAQGSVSSIYLLHLLKISKADSTASWIFKSSMLFMVLSMQSFATVYKLSSNSSFTFLSSSVPAKYLFIIAIVLLTRFPRTFARSVLYLSVTSFKLTTPSLSYGISWSK